jgi:hypothetical protein
VVASARGATIPGVRHAPLVLLALLSAAACSSRESVSTPQPPPGTGEVATDLTGTWAVAELERIDGSTEPLPMQSANSSGFLALQIGNEFRFEDGEAIAPDGTPLYREVSVSQPNYQYLNLVTDRSWLFDLRFSDNVGCLVNLNVIAAFGTVDEDTLVGTAQVFRLSTCVQTNWLMPDPNGMFRVVLHRVTMPLDGLAPEQGR